MYDGFVHGEKPNMRRADHRPLYDPSKRKPVGSALSATSKGPLGRQRPASGRTQSHTFSCTLSQVPDVGFAELADLRLRDDFGLKSRTM